MPMERPAGLQRFIDLANNVTVPTLDRQFFPDDHGSVGAAVHRMANVITEGNLIEDWGRTDVVIRSILGTSHWNPGLGTLGEPKKPGYKTSGYSLREMLGHLHGRHPNVNDQVWREDLLDDTLASRSDEFFDAPGTRGSLKIFRCGPIVSVSNGAHRFVAISAARLASEGDGAKLRMVPTHNKPVNPDALSLLLEVAHQGRPVFFAAEHDAVLIRGLGTTCGLIRRDGQVEFWSEKAMRDHMNAYGEQIEWHAMPSVIINNLLAMPKLDESAKAVHSASPGM